MNEQAISSRHLDIMYKQQKQDPLEDIQAILGQCADKLPAEERADSGLGLYSDSGSEFGRRNSDENESRPCSSARSLSQNTSAGDSIGSSRSASGRPSPSPSPSTSLANVRPAAMMSAEGPGAAVGDGSFADDGSGRKTTVTEHEIAEEEREGILAEEFVELLQECYKLQQELNDRINSSSSASTRHHGGVAGLGPKPNLIVRDNNVKFDSSLPRQVSQPEKDGLHDDKKKRGEGSCEGCEECDGPNLFVYRKGKARIWMLGSRSHKLPQADTQKHLRPHYHAPPPGSAAGMDPRNIPHCFPAESATAVATAVAMATTTATAAVVTHTRGQLNGYVERERTTCSSISFFYVHKDTSDVKFIFVIAIRDDRKVSLQAYHNPQPNDEKIQLDPHGTPSSDEFSAHSGNLYMGLDLSGESPQLIALVEEDFKKKVALYMEEMKNPKAKITFLPFIKVKGSNEIALFFDGRDHCYYVKPKTSPSPSPSPSPPSSPNQFSPVLSIVEEILPSDPSLYAFFHTDP